jgi:hypothetical protein
MTGSQTGRPPGRAIEIGRAFLVTVAGLVLIWLLGMGSGRLLPECDTSECWQMRSQIGMLTLIGEVIALGIVGFMVGSVTKTARDGLIGATVAVVGLNVLLMLTTASMESGNIYAGLNRMFLGIVTLGELVIVGAGVGIGRSIRTRRARPTTPPDP